MANTTKFIVEVTDGGSIGKTTKDAGKLRDTLESAAAAGGKTSKALQSAKVATSTASTGKTTKTGESVAYAQARGNIGTGAEARDFAKQSEGLGGLVRLYATYAANIYAAGAAFRALSEAASTTNIIEGLNQLGAASGTALGSLSKKFAEASGGAISLREAMQSTAQATAAGLSEKQFLKLGEVAKKASQALGVNMTDAVSRLTRGITKLEPELLDELGIFTKIGPATENYAKSIGKTAASLTDFEKRQAFANAVLQEGTDKFSGIDIPTNPYDKLLGTLKNVSFTILELVNKALMPLVKLLSESPTALTAIIAGLGAMVLKSAIPAIGQYKTGLRQAADASQQLWEGKAAAAASALAVIKANNKKEILAEQEKIAEIRSARVDEYQRNLQDLSKGTATRGTQQKIASIADPTRAITDISQTEIRWLEARSKGNTVLAATYGQVAAAIRAAQKAEQDYIDTGKKLDIKNAQAPGRYSAAALTQIEAEKLRKRSASQGIIAQAGEDTSTGGLRTAFGNLGKSIKEGELGAVKGTFTGIAGAATIVTTKVGGIISSFSGLLPYLGLAIAAFELISSRYSMNAKEAAVYNTSLDDLVEKTEIATRVQKLYGDTLSVDSLLAKANAITNLADSIEATTNALKEANAKAGNFDRFIDGFLTVIGKDLKSKFTTSISYSISEGLKGIADPALKAQAEDEIRTLLDIKETTKEAIGLALEATATPEEILAKGDALSTVMKKVGAAADEAAKPLKPVKEGFATLDKAYTELANSLANKDLLTSFALALISQATIMKNAFSSVQNTVAVLNEVLLDTSKVSKFPQEARDSILAAAANYKILKDSIDEANKAKDMGEDKVRAAKGIREGYEGKALPKEVLEVVSRLEIEGLAAIGAASDTIKTANEKLSKISTNLTSGLNKSMEVGFKLIQAPLESAIAQASINSQKTLLGALPQTAETAKYAAQLEAQSIDIRIKEIQTIRDLTVSIDKDRISREKQSIESSIKALPGEGKFGSVRTEKRQKLDVQLKSLQDQEDAYTKPESLQDRKGSTMDDATANILNKQSGFETQMVGLLNQREQAIFTGILNATKATFGQLGKNLDTELEALKVENARFLGSTDFTKLSGAEQEREKGARAAKEANIAAAKARLVPLEKGVIAGQVEEEAKKKKLPKEFVGLGAKAGVAADEELRNLQANQEVTAGTVALEVRKNATIVDTIVKLDKEQKIRENNLQLSNISAQGAINQLDADQNRLDLQMSIGALTKDDYDAQKRTLELKKLGIESDMKRNELITSYMGTLADITKEEADPKNADKTAELKARKIAVEAVYKAEIAGLNNSITLKTESINLQKDMTERIMVYADTFKSTVNSMSDALVDFAITGEQSFGDLIESMITDLIKFEQRQNLQQLFSSKENGGIGTFTDLAKSAIDKTKELFGFGESAAAKKAAKIAAEATPATAAELADSANMGFFKPSVADLKPTALGATELTPMYVSIVSGGFGSADFNSPSFATATELSDPANMGFYKSASQPEAEEFQKGIVESADKGISEVFNTKSQTMLSISDSFTKTFGGIANGFSNVINSVLSSISGGGGGGGLLSSLVNIGIAAFAGPSGQATAGAMQDTGFISAGNIQPGGYSGPVYPNALGGVYDQGRVAFAKGAAFTDTIVTRPTTFAFAKGAGLMGESGPEAIMPLKRGANGSLGVQGGGGGNVDVVVNNYGTEKATTKQTADSRGNRKIEVIIGEMTAAEMNRPNSPIQNTMRGTYGMAPQLTRR